MQGPFPGMDPYLEAPGFWPDAHSRLIIAIGDALAASVASDFVVRIEQRVYSTDVEEVVRQGIVEGSYLLPRPIPGGTATMTTANSPAALMEPLL